MDSSEYIKISKRVNGLPQSAQHNIVEYIGFRLYNGRYIAKLLAYPSIYRFLRKLPIIIQRHNFGEYEDTYLVNLDIQFGRFRKNWKVKSLCIEYDSTTHTYITSKKYYKIHGDGEGEDVYDEVDPLDPRYPNFINFE